MIRNVGGRKIHIFPKKSNSPCIFVPMDRRDEPEILASRLFEGADSFMLIIFDIHDWNAELSPYPCRPAFGKEQFAGKGKDTLSWLTDQCIPMLIQENLITDKEPQYIAGYSLAGLFALWSLCESNHFDGAASCSGSFWVDGWMEYLKKHLPKRECNVYLSLGKQEEKSKNVMFATVGDRTRETYREMKRNKQVKNTTLQWNKGGHFADSNERLLKGIQWLLQNDR